jgi:sporulation protein YlmC with PRC-barrel domain
MLFSELRGQKVIGMNSADNLGRVDAFVIDPEVRRVAVIALGKVTGELDMLPWERVISFGADAVTAPGITSLIKADGRLAVLADRHHQVIGKLVLDTAGRSLGTVRDVDVDPPTGAVVSLILEQYQIPGAALIGIGDHAVVVVAAAG